MINVLCNALHVSFKLISYLHLHFHMGLIVHDMYIYNYILAFFKVLINLIVLSISRFYDNYTSRSGVGGLDSTIYAMS